MEYLEFNTTLNRYLNAKHANWREAVLLCLSTRAFFRFKAGGIIDGFNGLGAGSPVASHEKISVHHYKGGNAHIGRMEACLSEDIKTYVCGAYVHGSLATHEEIAYSDFDGLLVLDNRAFESRKTLSKVANRVHSSKRIMKDFDPLQHHGWFVITEKELKNEYPETYFPSELFKFAKSILTDKGMSFEIKVNRGKIDYLAPFLHLACDLEKKLGTIKRPFGIYELKSLLSEFMLLPSLYVQAKRRRGIFKKQSFAEAQKDFSPEEWSIMDRVSKIRENWNADVGPVARWLLKITNPIFFKLALKMLPAQKGIRLEEGFYGAMLELVILMKQRQMTYAKLNGNKYQ